MLMVVVWEVGLPIIGESIGGLHAVPGNCVLCFFPCGWRLRLAFSWL